ncbi:HlyD family secretion protein [Portibacter marinus]|uniref:HlyD family secretion protein n=1 Tax=Portibacter marinus TaxID=2898660 RepID=UPI001F41D33C|nr:HlyD family efflux transporter periplasmic adaptor subunit [Portibacter marinus]
MLNISLKRVNDDVETHRYGSFRMLEQKSVSRALIIVMLCALLISICALFLPWTQNIRSKGYVTTLNPDDRPQTIQNVIGGRIDQWYVVEGQSVNAGDTIIRISEVKEEYLDPEILNRTQDQITAKSGASKAYLEKARNLEQQLEALRMGLQNKLDQNDIKTAQVKLMIQSDSIELVAARTKYEIAQNQLRRQEQLYEEGLKSLTDLEAKRFAAQEANAKVISLQNKLSTHLNELENLRTNALSIRNDYNDKMAKSRSERMSALSAAYDADATMNKLQSNYNAYEVRQKNYFITSPIDGIVTRAIKTGIGELVSAGSEIVSIIPANYQRGVEMYVEAMDVPLLDRGQEVRIQFDGWPAIVFSGWPNNSYGTFGGTVFAIDNFISPNGKYRVLVAPDPTAEDWPEEVRIGGGANVIILLKNVSVGYELWRQLNGFPPDYYKDEQQESVKTKAPLRKIK